MKKYIFRFLGIPVFEKRKTGTVTLLKIFGNLFQYRYKESFYVCRRTSFKVFSKPVYEKILMNNFVIARFYKRPLINYNFLEYRIFGRVIRKVNLLNVLKKELRKIKYDYDDIYFLWSNGGEAFLFFGYCLKGFLEKNKSKKPLFIAVKKFSLDLIKMYMPQANAICLEDLSFLASCLDGFSYKNHKLFMIFSHSKFYEPLREEIMSKDAGGVHFFDYILKTLDIEKDSCTEPEVIIPPEVEESFNKKMKKLNLNLDNFVIFAPEAITCKTLSKVFWEKAVREFKNRGVDIFVNSIDEETSFEGCKTISLDYLEVFLLARKTKALICVKSGFPEILLPSKCPIIAVYTEFRNKSFYQYPVEKIISAYSMKKLPLKMKMNS